jgi:hypothetical protein
LCIHPWRSTPELADNRWAWQLFSASEAKTNVTQIAVKNLTLQRHSRRQPLMADHPNRPQPVPPLAIVVAKRQGDFRRSRPRADGDKHVVAAAAKLQRQ